MYCDRRTRGSFNHLGSLRVLVVIVAACLVAGGFAKALPAGAEETGGADRPIRDKWALIVGVGTFQHQTVPKLRFAAKDARDFRNYLVTEANFAPDHVRLLVNEKATQRRLLSELGNKILARVAKPDDLVVLFFSTHGSPSQFDLRGKNYLVAYDTDPDDLFSTGIEMNAVFESLKARVLSDRVLLVLDACHSGSIKPGEKGLVRTGNFDANQLSQGSGHLVICSSGSEERSWESKRYQNGIFTRKLIESLRTTGKKTKLGHAFPNMARAVAAEAQEDYVHGQNPTLKSQWKGNELVLAVPAAAPQSLPVSVKEILEADSTYDQSITRPPAKPSTPVAPGPPSPANAVAPAGDFKAGVKLYESGDFGSAVSFLTAAVRAKDSSNADAHYYLANALMRLNRVDDALREYRESYKLNPRGPMGAYCLRVINHYSGTRPAAPMPSPASSAAVPAAPTTNPVAQSPSQSESSQTARPVVNLIEVERVKSSMPRLTTFRSDSPHLADILNWSVTARANYVTDAQSRLDQARYRLDEAQEVVRNAEYRARGLVPSARTYGETEVHFNARVGAGHAKFEELVAPYRAELEARSRGLSEANSIYESCVSAQRQLKGY